jgi:virulence-associated protein VagC
VTITIKKDGTLKLPKEALERLGTNQVQVRIEGKSVTLEPRKRKLHEIEDPEERMRAFDEWAAKFAQPTGVQWPPDYNVRDDIYD